MPSIENLSIDRIVIHEVLKRTSSDHPSTPKYGSTLLIMDSEGKLTLQNRLVLALGNNSHCIEMDIVDTSESSISEYSKKLCDSIDSQFVIDSKHLADKLAESQVSVGIPGGILVIITGRIGVDQSKYCSVIKAEIHSGFHKKMLRDSITAEFLPDLFLTPQQKFYKIGMFILTTSGIKAFVYDHNMTRAETKQAAKYFYEVFLGCKIASSSKAKTQDFFLLTREFINELEIDDATKLDYQDSLYSYLKNANNSIVSVSEFSELCFSVDMRDLYNTHMNLADFPNTAIIKDIELIKNKLKRRRINFTSGVVVQRKSGSLADVLTIERSDEYSTTVKITGKIENQLT